MKRMIVVVKWVSKWGPIFKPLFNPSSSSPIELGQILCFEVLSLPCNCPLLQQFFWSLLPSLHFFLTFTVVTSLWLFYCFTAQNEKGDEKPDKFLPNDSKTQNERGSAIAKKTSPDNRERSSSCLVTTFDKRLQLLNLPRQNFSRSNASPSLFCFQLKKEPLLPTRTLPPVKGDTHDPTTVYSSPFVAS